MIERTVDWCNANRFLLFFGVLALLLAGIWSLYRIPLDALPDISDVQVIIHTEWTGQPPNLIEDQVTYPIVTAMLAAPHVKAVRAQTMPSCSKTVPTSTGRGAACLSTYSRLQASFPLA
jgi:Cu(I)/Ag(I) efflux system membrane protein CusA/SilA